MKIIKAVVRGYIYFAKTIPADLAFFLGIFLQQIKWLPMTVVDEYSFWGSWFSWAWSVIAAYFVISGVILYFSRYAIRKHELQHRKK